MRYEPVGSERAAPWATTAGTLLRRFVSTVFLVDRAEARNRQAAELDVWEDEGGTTAGRAPESDPDKQVR